ncbi:meteorin-like protein [Oratosquilla oratoria]|uniref:meteorin-like protein n=1 Tax=Oratosquilla oratoria TaxID=337810 RepID=UPI003F769887
MKWLAHSPHPKTMEEHHDQYTVTIFRDQRLRPLSLLCTGRQKIRRKRLGSLPGVVRWQDLWGHVVIMCCVLVMCVNVVGADSNGCDFTGSGLEQDGRGVQPVNLGCSSGRVEWRYPRGALRISFSLEHYHSKGREFHGCIKADKHFDGARVYIEGHRSLLPLFSPNDGKPRELVRCFTSFKGHVSLYVEAEPVTDTLRKDVAAFEYDLLSLPKDTSFDPLEECRPCSEDEMVRQYCRSDFVARGIITGVSNDPRLLKTQVTVSASKVFQQTSPVFRPVHRQPLDPGNNALRADAATGSYEGVVQVPLKCGAQHGEGEFIFMGRIRLGEPMLWCAPRRIEWAEITKRALSAGSAHCILET